MKTQPTNNSTNAIQILVPVELSQFASLFRPVIVSVAVVVSVVFVAVDIVVVAFVVVVSVAFVAAVDTASGVVAAVDIV